MRGIGELSLRHNPAAYTPIEGDRTSADHSVALRIYDLAARRSVPVNIHFDVRDASTRSELERALAHNPNAVIIWAHMGAVGSPRTATPIIRDLLKTYPNLYIDLSGRDPITLLSFPEALWLPITTRDGALIPDYKSLLEEFPDRFLFGLDLGNPTNLTPEEFASRLIAHWRSTLAQLKPETANKIAHENIERILSARPSSR